MSRFLKFSGPAFYLTLLLMVFIKLVFISDLSPQVVYAPHDDSLYVMRAFNLLNEGFFGPYDSRVLAKLPGMSFMLAAMRSVGLPYFAALNLLYILAGIYVLAGLRRFGVGAATLLFVFLLYVGTAAQSLWL